jgi:two-component system NtrC family sensor kinase
LVVARGSSSRPLVSVPPEGLTIGRDQTNLLSLDDTQASRRHARLEFNNGVWFVTDLNSANGVFVNGERVRRQALSHGDQIQIGQTMLVFQIVP